MKDVTILVIDDEPAIRLAVSSALVQRGARVLEASTAAEGIALARSADPDLFVLDLGLPDGLGIDVCREVRKSSSAPIVILTARHAESEKVALLEAGADDFVSKPFGMSELEARIRAQLRRARTPVRGSSSAIDIDGLTIDLGRREVRRGDASIHLSPTEWAILRTLAAAGPGQPVTLRQIFDAVWGREYGNPSQYLRVYVTHLRRKIERDPTAPHVILTEAGVGYRLGRA